MIWWPVQRLLAAKSIGASSLEGLRRMVAEHAGIPSERIPFSDAMGVPITFMDKFCPAQFEVLGTSDNGVVASEYKMPHFKRHNEPYINGRKTYKRLFIRRKRGDSNSGGQGKEQETPWKSS